MSAKDIVTRLGKDKFFAMFAALSTQAKRELANQAGFSTKRTPALLSTEKRNLVWAENLWNHPSKQGAMDSFLYVWILSTCRPILISFLDFLEVPHQEGITENDFLQSIAQSKLIAAANHLLNNDSFSKEHVAIYLLFLETSEKDQRLNSLQLEQYLE